MKKEELQVYSSEELDAGTKVYIAEDAAGSSIKIERNNSKYTESILKLLGIPKYSFMKFVNTANSFEIDIEEVLKNYKDLRGEEPLNIGALYEALYAAIIKKYDLTKANIEIEYCINTAGSALYIGREKICNKESLEKVLAKKKERMKRRDLRNNCAGDLDKYLEVYGMDCVDNFLNSISIKVEDALYYLDKVIEERDFDCINNYRDKLNKLLDDLA